MGNESDPPSPSRGPSPPDVELLRNGATLHPSGYEDVSSSAIAAPSSRPASDAPSDAQDRNLIERMARFRTTPLSFLREVSLHVSGTGWRSYDNMVGQPVFYPGFSEKMKQNVLSSPMLRAKIEELAERRVKTEEGEGRWGLSADNGGKRGNGKRERRDKRKREVQQSLEDVVEKMTDDMIAKMESKRFIRSAYYLVTQLLTRAYHQGIHVSSEEIVRLRAVALEAQKKKQSIIFLPCHRSHVDYVSLAIICYRLGLTLPVVVAGDNLNFPLVGPFLQNAAAMWIRRSFGDDQLYTTLVQAYVDTLLQEGFNFECFVEGTRSRTGKLLQPKFGILGFLLDSLLSGRVKDAIICPVSTQYDKVIEVNSYVSELLGQPKQKENLMDFLSASSILSLRLGRVDVRFHEPWSLRSFIDDQLASHSKLPPQMPSANGRDETRTRLLRTLGYRVLSDINAVSVVMPTALIGTVLLTLRGRGVGKSELVRRVDWLCARVKSQGGRVAHFAGLPTETVVERGLEVLGPELVGVVYGLVEPTYYAVDRFQLSFYRNMTIHLFVSQAIVSASLYTRVKQGGGIDHQRMPYDELRDQVLFLSQLFRGEFIYPTEGLEINLAKTIRGLEQDKVIHVIRSAEDPSKVEYVELSAEERELGRENYDFYCFMIWPFIEASWLGAVSLMALTPPAGENQVVWLDMKKVQDMAQLLGKTLYHQGDLSYFEAVNKETLKNAYQRFEDEGILLVAKSKDNRIPTTVRLAPDWVPPRSPSTDRLLPEGRLWAFAELISQSRREGKNRRDGNTVRTRVLGLVEQVADRLWDQARPKENPESKPGSYEKVKRRKPRRAIGEGKASML